MGIGMKEIIIKACIETFYMSFVSTALACIIGIIPGIILTLTAPDGLRPNKIVYGILDFIVNVFRSFPFIILMVILIPVTRFIVGKTIGTTAAIVPLTIAAIPFFARLVESALRGVDSGVIEAGRSLGASNFQIVWHIMMKEAVPNLISGAALTFISVIGYSAMGGAIGAGGLGDVAIRYGYQSFNMAYLIITSVILIVFVQIIQIVGNAIYEKKSI